METRAQGFVGDAFTKRLRTRMGMYVDQPGISRLRQSTSRVQPHRMVPYKRDDTTLDCDIDVATIDMCLLGTIKADDPRTIPEYGQLLIHGVTDRPKLTCLRIQRVPQMFGWYIKDQFSGCGKEAPVASLDLVFRPANLRTPR